MAGELAPLPASAAAPPAPDGHPAAATADAATPAVAARQSEPATTIARFWPTLAHLTGLFLLFLIGCGMRAALVTADGYIADVNWFGRWTTAAAQEGLTGLYANTDVNYPPFYVLVMWGLGSAWQAVGGDFASEAFRALLRAPAVLADLALAILLYLEGRRLLGRTAGLVAAALYWLNPATVYVTAFWGQVDSVHSLWLTAALIALNRRRSGLVGAFAALALLQKLQSIAIWPLFIIEAYRQRGFRGWLHMGVGAVLVGAVTLAPFAWTGTLKSAIERGYFQVVGQYPDRSSNAYNLWYLLGTPLAMDTVPPQDVVRWVAGDADRVAIDAHPLLQITVRHWSLALFALVVLTIVAIQAGKNRVDSRAFAAGLLALAFFVLPTEMHERYLFPALALLPLWAIGSPGRAAAYAALSALFLINLIGVLGVTQIEPQIGGSAVLLLVALLVGLLLTPREPRPPSVPDLSRLVEFSPRRRLITFLRGATLVLWLAVVAGGAWAGGEVWRVRQHRVSAERTLYLSDLEPERVRLGWGELGRDESPSGSPLELGGVYYTRGIGTHAPGFVQYRIPAGYDRFVAQVGVNARHDGAATVKVYLDDVLVEETPRLTNAAPYLLEVEFIGEETLRLVIESNGTSRGDHIDWGGARLEQYPPLEEEGAEG